MKILKWLGEGLALLATLFVLVFLLLTLVTSTAHAAGPTAHVTFVLPTKYIDETPLPLSAIKETLIEWRRVGAGELVGSVRVAAPATAVDVPGLVCGDFVFTGFVITKTDLQSGVSNAANYPTGIACVPKAPALSVG